MATKKQSVKGKSKGSSKIAGIGTSPPPSPFRKKKKGN